MGIAVCADNAHVIICFTDAPVAPSARAGGGGLSGVPPKGGKVDLNRCMGPVAVNKNLSR